MSRDDVTQRAEWTVAELVGDPSWRFTLTDGERDHLGEMIQRALRRGTINLTHTPVLCGSAFRNKGVQQLLDAVVEALYRGEIDLATASARLRAIDAATPRYGAGLSILAFGVAAAAAALFFGAGWREAAAGLALGLLTGLLAAVTGRSVRASRVHEFLAAMAGIEDDQRGGEQYDDSDLAGAHERALVHPGKPLILQADDDGA